MITKTCEVCGNDFQIRPYRAKTARFCGKVCCGKWHMMARTMPNDHKAGNNWRANKPPANAFPTGHEPWNKGVKGLHLSPETEFKKGYTSHKRVPVGTVRIRPDKNGCRRAFIKTDEPNTWRMRAVVVWENVNGPVPKGKVIHHKDKNALNDELSNLDALTRKEHIAAHREDLRHNKVS